MIDLKIEDINLQNKLNFFQKNYFLISNLIILIIKIIINKNKKYRNIDYIRQNYDNARSNINLKDLTLEEFVFTKDYKYKKKNILLKNEIYHDLFYKPTLVRYLRLKSFIELNSSPGDLILDIGCGWGSAVFYLASKFKDRRFSGIDLSKISIDQALKAKSKYNLKNIDFMIANVADDISLLKSKIESPKIIYTINALEQMPNFIDKAIRNILSLNASKIIFFEPDISLWKNNLLSLVSKIRSMQRNKLQALTPKIKEILIEKNNYELLAIKNLGLAVNPFNCTSEIIIKKLEI